MIEIRTLGRTSVAVEGAELSGEAAWPKALALMVYVAWERGPVRRDELLGMLWPEREEKRARRALNQLLYTLRKTNPELDLESREDEIGFGAEVWIDVQEFERCLGAGDLEGAVKLYAGHFLADLVVDAPEFDHWADRQRAELQRRFRKAALELCEAAMESGNCERARTLCRRLVDIDPLDDEAQHAFIECLYLSGDRVAALRQYDSYRELLARELEVEPLENTRALAERIRTEQAAPRAVVKGSPSTARTAREAPEAEVAGAKLPMPVIAPRRPRAIARALARAATALRAGRRALRRRRARVVEVVALVALFFVAVWIWRWAGAERRTTSVPALGAALAEEATRIAVLPFDARGLASEEEDLAAGGAQLLALNLDGLGPIQTVEYRALLRRWEGDALGPASVLPPERLREFVRRLGATSFILGTVHGSGGQLRITADLVGLSSGRLLARADVRGPRDGLFDLIDQLTLRLLERVWAEAEIPAPRVAARSTASLPALKHYLEAEGHYRRAEWEEAIAEYRKALREDSTFVPAIRSLAETILWAAQDPRAEAAELFERARRLAVQKGAPERERLFDIARFHFTIGDGTAAVRLFEDLAARYPDDFSIQYQLADGYFHFGPRLGIALEVVAGHLEGLLRWDTAFAPAIDHLWWTALWRGEETLARRWSTRYVRAAPLGMRSAIAPIATAIRYGDERERDGAVAQLRDLPGDGPALTALAVLLGPDADPTRARQALLALWEGKGTLASRLMAAELMAALEFATGRPQSGFRWLDDAQRLGLPADEVGAWRTLVLVYGLAEGRWERYPAPTSRPGPDALRPWVRDTWLSGVVGLRMGDRAAARSAADRLASVSDSTPTGALAIGLAAGLRAELALSAGDTVRALEALRRSVARYPELALLSAWETVPYYRYELGRLEARRGNGAAASAAWRSLEDRSLGDVLLRGKMQLALASGYEETGERREAASRYAAAAGWWAQAEPAFAAQAAAARAGLARTSGEN